MEVKYSLNLRRKDYLIRGILVGRMVVSYDRGCLLWEVFFVYVIYLIYCY